jgi:CelD/BcsL family acetyltransferase involved in cellulose biosynthesis
MPLQNPADTDGYTCETLLEHSAFESIRDEWDILHRAASEPLPTLTSAWLSAWWQAFGEESQLSIRLVRKNGTLVLGAPLCISRDWYRGRRVRKLHLLSNVWVDRSGLLATGNWQSHLAIFVKLLMRQLGSEYDLLEFGPLASDSILLSAFRKELTKYRALVEFVPSLRSPYMMLAGDWDNVLAQLSSSFRQTVKRKLRKIDNLDGVRFEVRHDPEVFAEIGQISLETWQHDEGTSMVSQLKIREFYSTIIERASQDQSLRVGLMWIKDQPVAFEFNLISQRTLYNFKLGFRKSHADLSPGLLLKVFVLKELLSELKGLGGCGEYDLMGTDEAYKLNWSKNVRDHVRIIVFSRRTDLILQYWLHQILKPQLQTRTPWLFELIKKLLKPNS